MGLACVLVVVCLVCGYHGYITVQRSQSFYIDWNNDRFVKDGMTWQYAAGGIHYFRSPPQYWEQRISTARSAGLNAIQSYVAWNVHEQQRGVYDFSGRRDIVRFIKEVHKQDMTLILRVGPYICGGKSFGGLPPWLFPIPDMAVRSENPAFMQAAEQWLRVLLKTVRPYLYNNGGPIILIQIENEYGAYGCDGVYLSRLYDMFYSVLGDEVAYFTTDGPGDYTCGSFNSTKVLSTIDYFEDNDKGMHTDQYFEDLRRFQPQGPLVNSEYYTGWLYKWGSPHDTRSAETLRRGIRKILSLNASFSLFMWHGGSNFGIGSGDYMAMSTYDYDSPLSEAGDIKPDKYWAVRDVLEEFFPGNILPVPDPIPKLSGKIIDLKKIGSLLSLVSSQNFIVYSPFPLKMEEIGQFASMMAYQYHVPEPLVNVQLSVEGVHDRAYVITDGTFVQVLRREEETTFPVTARSTITVLVENMGHMAWLGQGEGAYSNQYKGIRNVTANGVVLEKWRHYRVDVSSQWGDVVASRDHNITGGGGGDRVRYNSKPLLSGGPSVFTGTLQLTSSELLDTYLDTSCWSKGFLVVNDIVIGRYWPDAGPQYTLYTPGVYLREGANTVTMVELQSQCEGLTVTFTDTHVIDGPVNGDVV